MNFDRKNRKLIHKKPTWNKFLYAMPSIKRPFLPTIVQAVKVNGALWHNNNKDNTVSFTYMFRVPRSIRKMSVMCTKN